MDHIIMALLEGLAPCGRTIGTAAPFPWPGTRCSCGEVHVPDPDFHCSDHATWESSCARCQDARIIGWVLKSEVLRRGLRLAAFWEPTPADHAPPKGGIAPRERLRV